MNSQEQDREAGRLNGGGVAPRQRAFFLASGAPLLLLGVSRRGIAGTAAAIIGSGLMYQGMTGKLQQLAGGEGGRTKSKAASVEHGQGMKVMASTTIDRPREEIYRFWRNFENLPHFMDDVVSVEVKDDKRSHWKVKGPTGQTVEWDAEIINEIENELIAWKSTGSADDVSNAGSVHFKTASGNRGTWVQTEINYQPPGGKLAALASRLLPKDPERMARKNLQRLKQFMELGEIVTIEGQPSARREGSSGQPMRPVPIAGRDR